MTAYINTLSEQHTQTIAMAQYNAYNAYNAPIQQSEYNKRLAEVRQKQYAVRRMMWSLLK